MSRSESVIPSLLVDLKTWDAKRAELLREEIKKSKEKNLPIKDLLESQVKQWEEEKLDNENQWNAMVEIIRVLREQAIPVDLSVLSAPLLSQIIKKLFLLKPTDAEWVLSNLHANPIPIGFALDQADMDKIQIH